MTITNKIAITGWGSISALGSTLESIWANYLTPSHHLNEQKFGELYSIVSSLDEAGQKKIDALRAEKHKYQALDPSVLYAICAARDAVSMADWGTDFGINIGSSRGATSLFEKYYGAFLDEGSLRAHPLSSPTTTLGNIATWIAHDLQSSGPDISHSITCSSALHAVLNGVAWIQSGLANSFLAGGAEAPLTAFTAAQMSALKIYTGADLRATDYPVRCLDMEKKQNTMALGEGAALFCLERASSKKALAFIEGIGYGTEPLEHHTSISDEGLCFQKSMAMALGGTKPSEVDAIVMHAPGTIKGDRSEYNAISKVFGQNIPALTSNKWKIGHTLGSSGALSMELALLMLQNQVFIKIPYCEIAPPLKLNKILVNAVGFGSSAVSLLLSRPS